MTRMATRVLAWVALPALAAGIAGCGFTPKPARATDVAQALQARGFSNAEQQPAEVPQLRYGHIDEAVALRGENLWIEILRIEDERTFKVLTDAGVLLLAVEVATEQPIPEKPELYAYQPFAIVVRNEPEPGQTEAALRQIFGK
jgi:hypothetical protein